MAQCLKAIIPIIEDQGSIPRPHMVANSHL